MSSYIKFSHLNPIRFYQYGKGNIAADEIPYFEYKVGYFQKYRYSDIVTFQILCQTPGLMFDFRVNNVDTGANVAQELIVWSGFLYGPENYSVYQYSGTLLPAGQGASLLTPMLTQIVITIDTDRGPIILKSEYIRIYPDTWSDPLIDNTKVITCRHDENDFDYFFLHRIGEFQQDMPSIMMRVEGGFRSDGFTPGGKYTMYQDLQYKPVILQSQPFNVHRFTAGDSFGVPEWIIDKLNRFFSCSEVKINGVQYCRNEGAKFERASTDPLYPRSVWVIDLLKSDNAYSENIDFVTLPADLTDFTADTTLVSADENEITIDQTQI